MNKKIGFYGAGNMGKAIMQGLLEAKVAQAEDIYVFDVYQPALDKIQADLGVNTVNEEEKVAQQVDINLVAVKPGIVPSVLDKIKDHISSDSIVVSIAAGVTLETLTAHLPAETKTIRVMPNTPALVGEGMSALAPNEFVTDKDKEDIMEIFSSFGQAKFLDEHFIDAVCGVSGSGPAYVYLFIEALADGAVLEGMTRPDAYLFAAQTVFGSAKMVLETGKHPGELKDMVCSPGGTTIGAVNSLEEDGFRSAVMHAVSTATKISKGM
ncbi:MAG TPA: pyrroline-5-carboxylate reductase [Tetragenococcus sp.]|nr:pyrroline-5-carboxylate reductase [Tetragenococcus sp.]